MSAGERNTPGKVLAHPFITMSHLIDCTGTAASGPVCVCEREHESNWVITSLPLQIRQGALTDMYVLIG